MTKKIKSTPEAWELGGLGEDEKYAKKATVDESALDDALELQMISVRLQKSLIDDLKNFALLEGLGYQPLMRRVLQRYVDGEKKMIANQCIAATIQAQKEAEAEIKDEVSQKKKIA
jgi:hypothetical protein